MATLGDFIPKDVWEKMGVNPYYTNHFWAHADETFRKLKERKEEDFCSDDVSLAVKTLERYYKAVLQLAHENDDNYRMPVCKDKNSDKNGKYLVDYTHGLAVLRTEIIKHFPDCFPHMPDSDEKAIKRKLHEYQNLYVDASYYEFCEYYKLQEILRFTESEKMQMMEFLDSKPFTKESPDAPAGFE